MESGELKSSPSLSPISLQDEIDYLCSFYLNCGVSYNDYWHGDYTMFKYYVEAHKERVKEQNRMEWLQGIYFEKAMAVIVANAFGKSQKYFDEPLQLYALNEIEKQAKAQKEREDVIKSLSYFNAVFNNKGSD